MNPIFLKINLNLIQFKEGARSEEYQPGSYYFVQEKLGPMLGKASAPEFRGAIILDSVLNFNDSVGSQTLPQGFDTVNHSLNEFN